VPSDRACDEGGTDKDTENIVSAPQRLYGVPLDSFEVMQATILPNQSLSEILGAFNISARQIYQLSQLPDDIFDERRLRADKPYTILHTKDSLQTAECFVYHPNPIDYVAVRFGDSIAVEKGAHPVDTLTHFISGTINSSLYNAILDAGGTPALVSELSDVYAWEIDFFGLQAGDCFRMAYTTYEVNGEAAGFGRILSAGFTHMGRERMAYTFDQGEGLEYFDEEGQSLRKTFLKAPLTFRRISSRFSYSRLHPVLKIRRPHLGVDYAAPRGTPVVAVGDGTVIKAAYSGGAGKMVKIRHNSNFTTAYLHLYKYGSGIKAGTEVKQGQVIGYVGSTGLSTGPHLDFRFYKNGVPVDPLKVNPPSANPIADSIRQDFDKVRMELEQQLQELQEMENKVLAVK
ncbi:MAG: peptidoglycan DD-metalloendopeptidase family protein, partial [Bacteroidota bacterium]